eukprot:9478783-Pyramimonas_sp.AAC.1
MLFRSAEEEVAGGGGSTPAAPGGGGGAAPLAELTPAAARLPSRAEADSWRTFASDGAHCEARGDGPVGGSTYT